MRHLTYGELTINGIEKLFEIVKIKPTDTFIDVGSGYGKIIDYVAQKYKIKCIGIEIDKEKYDISKKIVKNKNVVIINNDFRNIKRFIKNSTIVYSNCMAFPKEWVKEIYEVSNNIFIHNSYITEKNLKQNKIPLEVSWMEKVNYYIINKQNTNTIG